MASKCFTITLKPVKNVFSHSAIQPAGGGCGSAGVASGIKDPGSKRQSLEFPPFLEVTYF